MSQNPHERRVYKVRYETDGDGVIVASVPEVPGCRTQARDKNEARLRIRDALALFVDDADRATLVDE